MNVLYSDERIAVVRKERGVGLHDIVKTLNHRQAEGKQQQKHQQALALTSTRSTVLTRGPVAKAMTGLVAVLRSKGALSTLPIDREYVALVHGRVPRPNHTQDCVGVSGDNSRAPSSSISSVGVAPAMSKRDGGADDAGGASGAGGNSQARTAGSPGHRRRLLKVGESDVFGQSFPNKHTVELTEVTVLREVRSNSAGYLTLVRLRPIASEHDNACLLYTSPSPRDRG